jgi:antitoxin (DNA-binding transcriptional repressor) of toxin-antitoxin stability system
MRSKTTIKRKSAVSVTPRNGMRQMAAGEFKAKCLEAMAEVAKTGQPLLVTKRGEPFVEIGPPRQAKKGKKNSFIGRLEGVMEIVGDPDDLIKPVFPLEDYDMLK